MENSVICIGRWYLRWAGHVARMGKDEECIDNFCEKTSWETSAWKTEEAGV
jgi:hypothetical protein